jgi:tetratricopeptide (TPR) repeat protein
MAGELRQFRRKRLTPEDGRRAAERILGMSASARQERIGELTLDDPETLLPLLETVRLQLDSSPATALEEASFVYSFLEPLESTYPLSAFLLDEREYFLGESARIAGTACRHLSRRDEARRWFDLSEVWFLRTENASGNLAKLTYQRLALRIEERDFESVMQLIPGLVTVFEKLGMTEDCLKARFLEAAVLKETDRLDDAVEVYRRVARESETLRNDNLLALAYVNLTQLHSLTGAIEDAFEDVQRAAPLLQRSGNQVGLAKLLWGIGFLMRSRGENSRAVESYRKAQNEFAEIGMRADVAAIHLVIADLLLDAGQEKQAEWEIRQALPIIDEYKLVPEGFAALTLLRESLRRQQIDRQALRNLHGYFEELSA